MDDRATGEAPTVMLTLLLLGGSLASSGCSDSAPDRYVMFQSHQVATVGPVGGSASCTELDGGGGTFSWGGRSDDLWGVHTTHPLGLEVEIGSFDRVIVRKFYGRNMVLNELVDRFVVETEFGNQHSFMYWGADDCQQCPAETFDALAGDPFGCGVLPE